MNVFYKIRTREKDDTSLYRKPINIYNTQMNIKKHAPSLFFSQRISLISNSNKKMNITEFKYINPIINPIKYEYD
jgi:hypothetical protein